MKTRVVRFGVGLALLASMGGQAMAVCSATAGWTQLVNGTTETTAVTFNALAQFQSVTITDAAGSIAISCGFGENRTAAQVAASFQNIAAGNEDGQLPGGGCSRATTGTPAGISLWTSGAITGTSTVTFTSTTAATNVTDLSVANSGGTAPGVVRVQGSSSAVTGTLNTFLAGQTICYRTGTPWINQEWHQGSGGGTLTDWKTGLPTGVDPIKDIGTWSLTGTGATSRVVYTYGANTFTYSIWQDNAILTNIDYCLNGTTSLVVANVKRRVAAGQGACP